MKTRKNMASMISNRVVMLSCLYWVEILWNTKPKNITISQRWGSQRETPVSLPFLTKCQRHIYDGTFYNSSLNTAHLISYLTTK